MEITFRLTHEDYRRFVQLAQTRVAEQAKRASGWRGNPTIFGLASASVPLLVFASLYFNGLVDGAGVVTAAIAYAWGLWSMVACGKYWQRQYVQHFWPTIALRSARPT
jgi:hypothetical protein